MKSFRNFSKICVKNGFTIVELLVVIVVIGILATITIVSYSGISNKAMEVSIVSDLKNASTILEIDKVDNSNYPENAEQINGGRGLKMSGTNIATYDYDSGEYCLSIKNGRVIYHISSVDRLAKEGGCLNGYDFKAFSSGYSTTCAINTSAKLYCWGGNYGGEAGNGTTTKVISPTAVDAGGALNGLSIKSVDVGMYHTCALATNDKAYCWGMNANGELGDGTTTQRTTPVQVSLTGLLSGLTIKQISAGVRYTCAIASDDKGYCWGDNSYYNFGNGTGGTSTVNVTASAVIMNNALNGLTLKSISAGATHTCAIASNDKVYCWGYNDVGQLGSNSQLSLEPQAVDTTTILNGVDIAQVEVGYKYSCAVGFNGKAYCWGNNDYGVIGSSLAVQKNFKALEVEGSGALNGLSIKYIATGLSGSFQRHTCVIASDNQAYCWGNNSSGEVGAGAKTPSSYFTPAKVVSSGVLNGISLKYIHPSGSGSTCAMSKTKQVYCWGRNANGELGIGVSDYNDHFSPTQTVSF